MSPFTSGRYAAVASTLALVVAAGGTSYAAVTISGHDIQNGTITTQDVKDHTLKVKDLSPGAAAGLHGATGPVGAAGAPGATGPAGAAGGPGPIGPSTAWSVWNDATTAITGLSKTVLAQTLPAGSYTASAKTTVVHGSGTGTYVVCGLAAAGQYDYSIVTPADPGLSFSTLDSLLVFSTNTPTTLTFACYGTGGNTVEYKKMTVIKVGSLTNTGAPDVARPAGDAGRPTLP